MPRKPRKKHSRTVGTKPFSLILLTPLTPLLPVTVLGMIPSPPASIWPACELLARVAHATALAVPAVARQQHDGHHERVTEISDEKEAAQDGLTPSEAVNPGDGQTQVEDAFWPSPQVEMVDAHEAHDAGEDDGGGVALRRCHVRPERRAALHACLDHSVRVDGRSTSRGGPPLVGCRTADCPYPGGRCAWLGGDLEAAAGRAPSHGGCREPLPLRTKGLLSGRGARAGRRGSARRTDRTAAPPA